MSTAVAPSGFSQQSFESFLNVRQEPQWLTDQRKEHWRAFSEMDWPARNAEEWIRTDIRLFKLNQFSPPLDGAASDNSSTSPAAA